jgi:hypothetical protein
VLNTFYDFHRTWFSSNNMDTIAGYNASEQNGTMDLYDATEPALAITYSVFGSGQKYSDTLTRSVGVRAIRSEDQAVKTRIGWVASHAGRMISNSKLYEVSPFVFRDPTTANTALGRNINKHVAVYTTAIPTIMPGDLVGIQPTSVSFTVPDISLIPLNGNATDKGVNNPGVNYSYDFFKTFGGGVLGTPIYLLLNLGHPFNMRFNGQLKVPRRWSQQNMQTFLCASLPALRESDVLSFVDTTSSAPFRNSSSCVMCHATLDPMAYTARNIVTGVGDTYRPTQDGDVTLDPNGVRINPPAAYSRDSAIVTSFKATLPSVSGWPTEPVPNFHMQTPTGRLRFRSMTGVLVDQAVTGISGLGTAMTQTDDYYTCAAKRYFEFMTGISVPLYDRTDPRNDALNRSLSQEAVQDRLFVEKLGKDLRSSGSVIDVIEEIMSSDYYNKENFR